MNDRCNTPDLSCASMTAADRPSRLAWTSLRGTVKTSTSTAVRPHSVRCFVSSYCPSPIHQASCPTQRDDLGSARGGSTHPPVRNASFPSMVASTITFGTAITDRRRCTPGAEHRPARDVASGSWGDIAGARGPERGRRPPRRRAGAGDGCGPRSAPWFCAWGSALGVLRSGVLRSGSKLAHFRGSLTLHVECDGRARARPRRDQGLPFPACPPANGLDNPSDVWV